MAADKPIILFIDELDRCRPDYAVDMLEVIKHVFDVENVKVVLVTNTKQLRAAINHRYGVEVDAQKYLDKFLKYSFALPNKVVDPVEVGRLFIGVEYFKLLIRKNCIADELRGLIEERTSAIDFISDMIEKNDLSLRETERLVRFLEIYCSLSSGLNQGTFPYILLRLTGVFIFCFHPNLMDNINKNCASSTDFARLFNIQALPNKKTKDTDIIAVMLITHSSFQDGNFTFNTFQDKEYWQDYVDVFFQDPNIFPQKMDGVLFILKDTFRVLSLEQTPQ